MVADDVGGAGQGGGNEFERVLGKPQRGGINGGGRGQARLGEPRRPGGRTMPDGGRNPKDAPRGNITPAEGFATACAAMLPATAASRIRRRTVDYSLSHCGRGQGALAAAIARLSASLIAFRSPLAMPQLRDPISRHRANGHALGGVMRPAVLHAELLSRELEKQLSSVEIFARLKDFS